MDMNFEAMRVNELKTAFAKICAMHGGNETRAYIKGALVAREALRSALIGYRDENDVTMREWALIAVIEDADAAANEFKARAA